ncbi:MAG: hypothetical protein AB4040_20865 [Synechococcus sp.]
MPFSYPLAPAECCPPLAPQNTLPLPAVRKPFVKNLIHKIRQEENLRQYRLSRYARLRTSIKGPSAAIAFVPQAAPGTQPFCKLCRYFSQTPQIVCALHPAGPPHYPYIAPTPKQRCPDFTPSGNQTQGYGERGHHE